MAGYINGKVEVWYGDVPPNNLNVLWQKRIVVNGVECTLMYEYNNNSGSWQEHNSNAVARRVSGIIDPFYTPSQFYSNSDIDDTSSINKALKFVGLSGGGKVFVPYRKNKYIISSSLIIYSNTTLEFDVNAEIFLSDNSNCRMIENANKTTQSSLERIDHDIKIIGGIWDGNNSGQPDKSQYYNESDFSFNSGFLFSGIDRFTFCPTEVKNTRVYAMLICNVSYLLIENVKINVGDVDDTDNRDGIHILGPCENISIKNVKIHSEDNAIAINANDVSHGKYGTYGDIENVFISDIFLNNYDGGQGMLLLASDNTLKNVVIQNITGKAAYLINMSNFDLGTDGWYDNITIKNTSVEPVMLMTNSHIFIRGRFGTVNLENIFIPKSTVTQKTQNIDIYSTASTLTSIDLLNILNIKVNNVIGDGGVNLISIKEDCTAFRININGIYSAFNTNILNPIQLTSCSVGVLSIGNIIVDDYISGFIGNSLSSVGTLIFDGISSGVFTPEITGSDTDGSCTYQIQSGAYSLSGDLVEFDLNIEWTMHTGVGQAYISLPFDVNQLSVSYVPVIMISSGLGDVYGLIYKGTNKIQLYSKESTVLSALPIPESGTIYIHGSYRR